MAIRAHTRETQARVRKAVFDLLSTEQTPMHLENDKLERIESEMARLWNNCDTRTLLNVAKLLTAMYDLRRVPQSRST